MVSSLQILWFKRKKHKTKTMSNGNMIKHRDFYQGLLVATVVWYKKNVCQISEVKLHTKLLICDVILLATQWFILEKCQYYQTFDKDRKCSESRFSADEHYPNRRFPNKRQSLNNASFFILKTFFFVSF